MKSSAVKPGYSTMAICMNPPLGECFAILVGRNAHPANEIATQRLRGAEAATGGDHGDGVVGFLQLASSGLGADPFDVCAGRFADLVGEQPGEMPRAHGRATSE